MSRFYASITGSAKTEATRQGTVKSGIEGHIRGWDVGIKVVGFAGEDKDIFQVYLTGGSNGSLSQKHIGTFTAEDLA